MRMLHVLPLTLLGLLLAPRPAGALTVAGLKCEYRSNPLGIDAPRPRLSWTLQSERRGERQTSYQILVATTPQILAAGQGDLWDSGNVRTSDSLGVVYAGKPLASRAVCHWKVRAWDRDGNPSDWSAPGAWEMGLLAPADWKAQWLTDGRGNPDWSRDVFAEDPAPLFRKEFNLPAAAARARLYITGLGLYEAALNGERVGDPVLDPAWTRYDKRVLYSVFDVTPRLRRGANCLGVTLGNGWFNPLPLKMWGHLNLRDHLPLGRPRFIAQLEVDLEDGTHQTLVSDPTWKLGEGPIRFNNLYLGERYDARKELPGWDKPGFDDQAWRAPAVARDPVGELRAQAQPPIRAIGAVKPVKITEPKPGVYIYDLGENFSGWATFALRAEAGTAVTLRYGELLNKDGTLNPMTSVCGQIKGTRKTPDGKAEKIGGPGAPAVAWQSDTYICSGRGEERYTPRFTWHAFRYVEVTGLPARPPLEALSARRLCADVAPAGTFECSNELLNRIQAMCDATFRSNLIGVESDCPHRERFGYGGDIGAVSEAFMMNYDMEGFYAKAVRDFADSALPDGTFPDTAPYVGLAYCGVAWGMAHPLLQAQLYQYYGDRALVEEQYPAARRWLAAIAAKYPGHIVKEGLSDHEALTPVASPETSPLMATPFYAFSARQLAALARILGREAEAREYDALAGKIVQAYRLRFFNPSGKVGPGTQGSQALALYRGNIVTEDGDRTAAMKALLEDIEAHQGHLTTGIFGTKYMLDALSAGGHAVTAYGIVNQKTFPGWGHMLENGATTLWEHWEFSDNVYSHNHPMFGSVSQWFYHWLGGIRPAPEAAGFDRVVIGPQFVEGLDWVRCEYESVRGRIASNWRREGAKITLKIEIPVGATAAVTLPTAKPIRENGKPLARGDGIQPLAKDAHSTTFAIGSGRYQLEFEM